MTVYVVTMYRGGDLQGHAYVLGVWSDRERAEYCGRVESAWRGGKYKPVVSVWQVDGDEWDHSFVCDACGMSVPFADSVFVEASDESDDGQLCAACAAALRASQPA